MVPCTCQVLLKCLLLDFKVCELAAMQKASKKCEFSSLHPLMPPALAAGVWFL